MYTSDTSDYCPLTTLARCEDADVKENLSPNPRTMIFYVYAAFAACTDPLAKLRAVSFGVSYWGALGVVDSGPCGDVELQISSPTWPLSGAGTAITWRQPLSGTLIPVYWFAVELETGAASAFLVTENQDLGYGDFADDSIPALRDPIEAYGRIGFGFESGFTYCHTPDPVGAAPPDQHRSNAIDGGLDLLTTGTISFADSALVSDTSSPETFTIGAAYFLSATVRNALLGTGAVGIRKLMPWKTGADSLAIDANQDLVRVPRMHRFYELQFQSPEEAAAADLALSQTPGITAYSQDYGAPVTTLPNDPIFNGSQDPQWYLKNDGDRPLSATNADLHMPLIHGATSWPYVPQTSNRVTIGMLDVGLPVSHQDLHILQLSDTQKDALSHNWNGPNYPDWCGQHASKMSGVAAATTNNALGIAGICNDCDLLDIESCSNGVTCGTRLCTNAALYLDNLGYAVDNFSLATILVSFAGYDEYLGYNQVTALFYAYERGIPIIAGAGDQKLLEPQLVDVASVPFVIGVGGFTERDQFWGSDGCSPTSEGTTVGPSIIDICGPACGAAQSTLAIPTDLNCSWYGGTGLETSGASAAVAGALGLLKWIHKDQQNNNPYATADDWAGMVINSYRPWTTPPQPGYGCADCLPEWFGPGMLDVTRLFDIYSASIDGDLTCVPVYYGDPGATFLPDPTILDLQSTEPGAFTYRVWKFAKDITLYPNHTTNLPRFVLWPNHDHSFVGPETTTPLLYGPLDNEPGSPEQRLEQMTWFASAEVTGCHVSSVTDLGTHGVVSLYSYNIEKLAPGGSSLGFLFPVANMAMSLTYIAPATTDTASQNSPSMAPRFAARWLPEQHAVVFSWRQFDDRPRAVALYDASGRRVYKSDVSGQPALGFHELALPDGARHSRTLSAGVYFARLLGGNTTPTTRVVVVR